MRLGFAVLLLASTPVLAADPPGMVTKTYPIGDLIIAAAPAPAPVMMTECKVHPPLVAAPVVPMAIPLPAVPATPVIATRMVPPPLSPSACRNADHLVRFVPAMIKPLSWTEGGGTIRFDESGACLVVTQSADVQAHVAELLAALRQLQAKSKPQIMVQMTVLDAGPNFCEKAGLNLACDGAVCKKTVVGLTAEQAQSLTYRIRVAKEDGQVNVIAQPQLMVIDGQAATFIAGGSSQGNPFGIDTTITPTLSADGKYISLRLKCAHSEANKSPVVVKAGTFLTPADVLLAPVVDVQTIETTVALPNGATSVILGPTRTPSIPTIKGLNFNTTATAEARQSVIILTPHVVAQQERVQAAAPPMPVTAPRPVPSPPVAIAPPPPAVAPAPAKPEVAVSMTIIEARPEFFTMAGLDFAKAALTEESRTKCSTVGLTAEQAQALTAAIQSGKKAGYLEVLSCPRLSLEDGQNGTFQVGQRVPVSNGPKVEYGETGILTKVVPMISSDRKFVMLRVNYTHSELNPNLIVLESREKPGEKMTVPAFDKHTIDTTVALPSGGTGLIVGPVRMRQTRTEYAVPVLSQIPYVNRLYKTVGIGTEPRRQLIIVSPHVVASPEDRAAWIATEKQAVRFAEPKPAPVVAPKPISRTEQLVAEYRKACAEGRTEDAMKCAMQALAIDPKCFANEK